MSTTDHFFYAGMMDLRQEILDDIEASLITGDRAVPYYRDYGAGIATYENEPISFGMLTKLRYDVANWLAKRNMHVSNGDQGYPDRRAVTSQMAVEVRQTGSGSIEIEIPILTLFDLNVKGNTARVVIGG